MDYLQIIQLIITVVCGFLSYYFKTSATGAKRAAQIENTLNTLSLYASRYINKAEAKYINDYKSGETKFNYVVEKLVAMIPENLRGAIDEDEVKRLVQDSFDQLEAYAFSQIDKILSKEDDRG